MKAQTFWPVAWLISTGVLVIVLANYEGGWFALGFYVVVNVSAVVFERLRLRSWSDRYMVGLGWAGALQLPVVLWVYFSPTVHDEPLAPRRRGGRPSSIDMASGQERHEG